MWRIIICTLFAIQGTLAYSELNAQFTIEVEYYKPLEAAGGGYLEENASYRLQCNPLQSVFIFQTSDNSESSLIENDENIDVTIWLGENEHWVYKDLVKNELTEHLTSIQDNKYLVSDVIHPMQWKILPDTKVIEGIPVSKATCEHRGRSYIAWFAPSIPLSNGPWKLGGLPGLILEAYDEEKEVVFLFKALRQQEHTTLKMPESRGRKVNLATYLELNEKETRQYFDFMEARMKSTTGEFDIEFDVNFISWESMK